MPFSLRLDHDTETRIRRLTRSTGQSKSAIIKDAVARYALEHDARPGPGESAFDRLKPFIGLVRSGGANRSRQTHAKYRELLARKHRVTRTR